MSKESIENHFDVVAHSPILAVYSVKGQNMKKLDCPSFPMICGPSSGLDLQDLKKICPWTKGGTSVK